MVMGKIQLLCINNLTTKVSPILMVVQHSGFNMAQFELFMKKEDDSLENYQV